MVIGNFQTLFFVYLSSFYKYPIKEDDKEIPNIEIESTEIKDSSKKDDKFIIHLSWTIHKDLALRNKVNLLYKASCVLRTKVGHGSCLPVVHIFLVLFSLQSVGKHCAESRRDCILLG